MDIIPLLPRLPVDSEQCWQVLLVCYIKCIDFNKCSKRLLFITSFSTAIALSSVTLVLQIQQCLEETLSKVTQNTFRPIYFYTYTQLFIHKLLFQAQRVAIKLNYFKHYFKLYLNNIKVCAQCYTFRQSHMAGHMKAVTLIHRNLQKLLLNKVLDSDTNSVDGDKVLNRNKQSFPHLTLYVYFVWITSKLQMLHVLLLRNCKALCPVDFPLTEN